METKLFNDIIFGPIKSRRLGVSLGINLLPLDCKACNFDCIYCECGWTNSTELVPRDSFHKRSDVKFKLRRTLDYFLKTCQSLDYITFAGNGEPTLHPDFDKIVNDVLELRSLYFPETKIAVLTNSTLLKKNKVKEALLRIDTCILKLDAGTERMFQLINKPIGNWSLDKIEGFLKDFGGDIVIQTIFFKGVYNGVVVDNTTPDEVSEWLKRIKRINPKHVMLYTIDRATPAKGLEKVDADVLSFISEKVNDLGISSAFS